MTHSHQPNLILRVYANNDDSAYVFAQVLSDFLSNLGNQPSSTVRKAETYDFTLVLNVKEGNHES